MTGKIQTTVLRISGAIDVVASIITSFAIIVLVAAVLLQVVARYIFQQPPPYTEELARYAMIWAGLIGASMALVGFLADGGLGTPGGGGQRQATALTVMGLLLVIAGLLVASVCVMTTIFSGRAAGTGLRERRPNRGRRHGDSTAHVGTRATRASTTTVFGSRFVHRAGGCRPDWRAGRASPIGRSQRTRPSV